MRGFVLWAATTVSSIVILGSMPCFGQEKSSELTAEEIVSRHEATWEKLKRYSLRLDMKSRMMIGGGTIGKDAVTKVQPHNASTSALVYRDGDRSCCRFPAGEVLNVTKEIHDKDLFIYLLSVAEITQVSQPL